MLIRGATAAAAVLAGPTLAGCASATAVGKLLAVAHPVPLTVMLLGGAAGNGGTVPAALQDLVKPMQDAVTAARKTVSGLGAVTFQTGNDTTNWFPLPTTLFNVGQQTANRKDDPTLPMPDVVITLHSEMPAYLASRALDLEPYLKLHSTQLQGVPTTVLRQGRAFGYGQGTIQASLPLLRIPVVCALKPGITAVTNGKPWTAEQFQQQLQVMARDYPAPGAAPTPFITYGFGVAEMAAVGSGGQIAISTSSTCQATFADTAPAAGITQTVAWATYAAKNPIFGRQTFDYGILIADGSWVLSGGLPRFTRSTTKVPDPTGWTLAPVPVFPSRAAVPVRTVDVMVFRHTANPDVAAALACALASTDVQAGLMVYRNALVLRPDQALRQLQVQNNVQGPDILSNPANDFTDDDAYGEMAEGNVDARTQVRSDLYSALTELTGPAGYFGGYSGFNGPEPGFGGGRGGFRFNAATTQQPAAEVLQAAQQAANAGAAFTG